MPRRYRLENRKLAVEETRRRIVQATMELHNAQGVLDTTFDDIARKADVALATVYRHYPTIDHLVAACGALTVRTINPPMPGDAAAAFADVASLADRIGRLAQIYCSFYERSSQVWPKVLRDCHKLSGLQEFVAMHHQTIEAYAREALKLVEPVGQTIAVACALLDFPTWNSLVERGVDRAAIPEVLTQLLLIRASADDPKPDKL